MRNATYPNHSTLRTLLAITIAAAVVLCAAAAASACPTCKDGLDQADPAGQRVAAGFYYSILFMMSMPYIILTTVGGFAYRTVRKAKAARDEGNSGVKQSEQS